MEVLRRGLSREEQDPEEDDEELLELSLRLRERRSFLYYL